MANNTILQPPRGDNKNLSNKYSLRILKNKVR